MWKIEFPPTPEGARAVALCLGDIHWSDDRPPCRDEKDWFNYQFSYWDQMRMIHDHYDWRMPILLAGDLFHTWRGSHKLTNKVLKVLDDGRLYFAVAGQHEMPYHNKGLLSQSPYHTLELRDNVKLINPRYGGANNDLVVKGFNWGDKKTGFKHYEEAGDRVKIALVHDYCWKDGHTFPGAPPSKNWEYHLRRFKGFDIVIFGDNHKPFEVTHKRRTVYNCGAFVRRLGDERKHRPSVGVIFSDKSIARCYLDVSKDKFISKKKEELVDRVDPTLMVKTVAELGQMASKTESFATLIYQHLDSIAAHPQLREEVNSALKGIVK